LMRSTLLNFSAEILFSLVTVSGYLEMRFNFLKASYSGLTHEFVSNRVCSLQPMS
jgi:hypothetical protein